MALLVLLQSMFNCSACDTSGALGFILSPCNSLSLNQPMTWHVGLASEGGGGSIEPPKFWGGVWEKGSIDRHHYLVIMDSGAKGAEKFFHQMYRK